MVGQRCVERACTGFIMRALCLVMLVVILAEGSKFDDCREKLLELDTFETLSYTPAANTTEVVSWTAVEGPGMLGGHRVSTVTVERTTDAFALGFVSSSITDFANEITGHSEWSNTYISHTETEYRLQWDGDSEPELNPSGLGGVDLTMDGAEGIYLTQYYVVDAVNVTVDVYSARGHCQVRRPLSDERYVDQSDFFAFDDFSGECDWTEVGAVELALFISINYSPDHSCNENVLCADPKVASFTGFGLMGPPTECSPSASSSAGGHGCGAVCITAITVPTAGLLCVFLMVTTVLVAVLVLKRRQRFVVVEDDGTAFDEFGDGDILTKDGRHSCDGGTLLDELEA